MFFSKSKRKEIRNINQIIKDQDIEELFKCSDSGDFTIALFEILSNQFDGDPTKMNLVQQNLFLSIWLENYGQSDTIYTFLEEEYPSYSNEVINGLREIGALKSSEIIKQSVNLLHEKGSFFSENLDENSCNLLTKYNDEFSSYPDGRLDCLYRKYAEVNKIELIKNLSFKNNERR